MIGALVIVGVFLVVFRYQSLVHRCQEDDVRVCSLMDQLELDSSTRLHGTYTESHQSAQLFTIQWAVDKSFREIIKTEANTETMHLIYADAVVYLRDYSDDKWWKQSTNVVDTFDITLPFDPTTFFNNLVKDIQDPQNSLSYTHQDACGTKMCYVLTMKKANAQTAQFFLDEATDQLQQIVIASSDIEQKVVLDYKEFKVKVPIENIKIASENQNIFFENFLQQSSAEKQKPKYIEEFEKVQSQIEQNGGMELYASPTISL